MSEDYTVSRLSGAVVGCKLAVVVDQNQIFWWIVKELGVVPVGS